MIVASSLPDTSDITGGYRFRPMRRVDAERACAWRYEGVYGFHDLSASAITNLIEPRYHYHAIENGEGVLVGYCCFGEDARVRGIHYAGGPLDVGLAMAPDRTGRGHGNRFAGAVFRFGEARFRPRLLRLTVPAFNRRAVATYKRLAFAKAYEAEIQRQSSKIKFLVMTRPVMV